MRFIKPFKNLNIFHIIFDSQFDITTTLMRIQEFYESSADNIRDKYFTLEKLIHEYTMKNGKFDYFTKWSGFNFPKLNIVNWLKVFNADISEKERKFIDFLSDNIVIDNDTDYYIIATYRDEDISHEIAHALYYLDNEYKESMDELISNIDTTIYEAAYNILSLDSYCDNVIHDEIQAYFSTTCIRDLRKYISPKLSKKMVDKFKKVYDNSICKYE